jgi:HlyD family secretion protein
VRIVRLASYITIIAVFLAASLLSGCAVPGSGGAEETAQAPQGTAVQAEKTAQSVEVVPVVAGGIAEVLSYSGNLQAKDTVTVVPRVSGEIVELLVDVGDEVQKGDVLARLDSGTLESQVEQAEAAMAAAKAQLETIQGGARPQEIAIAQAQLKQAEANYAHLIATPTPNDLNILKASLKQAEIALKDAQEAYDEVSWRGDIKLLPESTALEQASIAYQAALATYNNAVEGARPEQREAAKAGVDMARYQLDLRQNQYTEQDLIKTLYQLAQAQAALDAIRLQLDWHTIKAPLDGVVSQRFLSVGAICQQNSTSIVTIVSKEVEVAISVEEARIGQVKVGQAAALRVNAYPGRDFSAVVSNVSPTADPHSHTFTVKVYPEDKEGLLKSGMFTDARLLLEQKGKALLVPKAALVYDGDKVKVFVVKDEVAVEHEVTVGLSDADNVEVSNGLAEGDEVIISGQATLASGDKVRVVSRSPASASVSVQ